jgi:uncharacterized membrane protein
MTAGSTRPGQRTPLAVPGVLLGIGLGGFVDGILLHQILQWHHMISAEEPTSTVLGLERNTLGDGWFHAVTWVAVVVGVALLWSRLRFAGRSAPAGELWGWVLVGWGVFNLVEGVINHHVLGLHHVRDDLGAPLGWDLAFLALGAALVVGGYLLARRASSS